MKIAQIIHTLKEPINSNLISYKKIENKKTGEISYIEYISWFDYCHLLDERIGLGQWEWSIISITTTHNRLFITGKLTIHCDDHSISQMATGTEILNCSSYGDPSSNAEAMALRRACAKFGLARYLWKKENKLSFQTSHSTSNPHPYKQKTQGEISRKESLQLPR